MWIHVKSSKVKGKNKEEWKFYKKQVWCRILISDMLMTWGKIDCVMFFKQCFLINMLPRIYSPRFWTTLISIKVLGRKQPVRWMLVSPPWEDERQHQEGDRTHFHTKDFRVPSGLGYKCHSILQRSSATLKQLAQVLFPWGISSYAYREVYRHSNSYSFRHGFGGMGGQLGISRCPLL